MVLSILLAWLGTMLVLAYRLNTLGGAASVSVAKGLQYVSKYGGAHPETLRLDQSYTQWALALNMTDPAGYIRAGLGFADGKGISTKQISPENPHAQSYAPYYVQSPGIPFIVGLWIRLFGENSIAPYFVFIALVHLAIALCAMLLAKQFLHNDWYILGTGITSLFCIPALDFNFAVGLFSSEPCSALCIGLALLSISKLRRINNSRLAIIYGVLFGVALAAASYLRDIYTTFAQYCFVLIPLSMARYQDKLKLSLVFVLSASMIFFAAQLPWRMRNQILFKEFAMSGSTYYGYGMLRGMWQDYKDCAQWCWNGALGIGNYLAPEKSKAVIDQLDQDKKRGSVYALKTLLETIRQHPTEAFVFKFSTYDILWFGQRCHPLIYTWCVLSCLSFLISLIVLPEFPLELWLFPSFLFVISCVIHYELRYSQPFYLLVTPVTMMIVIKIALKKAKLILGR